MDTVSSRPGVRSLKAIFVNSVHPERRHVSAMRLSFFADAMARLGHKIVLLTPTLDEAPTARPVDTVAQQLSTHDWAQPLLVTYTPAHRPLLDAIREDSLPALVRRPLTALLFATQGGVHGDRVIGSHPLWPVLADGFRPDLIWATFGDTGNLMIAQRLAQRATCPWVMDIKDSWDAFLRPGIRELMAWRFQDAAGWTTNAEHHGIIARRFHRQRSVTVYSGVASEMIADATSRVPDNRFRIVMVGGTYDPQKLAQFMGGLKAWLGQLPHDDRAQATFTYAGGSWADVEAAVAQSGISCPTTIERYLPLSELGALCQGAAVNCYLWAPFTFHHKLLELLASRRPVLAFPGEHAESISLAQQVGGRLITCADETALGVSFDSLFQLWKSGHEPVSSVDVSQLTWDAMAVKLEAFMLGVVETKRTQAAKPHPISTGKMG